MLKGDWIESITDFDRISVLGCRFDSYLCSGKAVAPLGAGGKQMNNFPPLGQFAFSSNAIGGGVNYSGGNNLLVSRRYFARFEYVFASTDASFPV